MLPLILQALSERRLLRFTYAGQSRLCEPHVLGMANHKRQLLCYQLKGGSLSGDIPEWRRFELGSIADLKLLGKKFDGPRPTPHPYSIWSSVIQTVK